MRRLVPEGVKDLLDVGCGGGAFGRSLKRERGTIAVTGVELTHWAAVAEGHLDRVLRIDVERDQLCDLQQYDCITFNDVLEHLVDPWTALRRLTAHLRPGGTVVASSPNLRHFAVLKNLLLRKRFDYESSGVMDLTHLRFFTVKTFPELFEDVGLRVVRSGGLETGARLPWKFGILNMAFFGALDDTKYSQVYCVARKPD